MLKVGRTARPCPFIIKKSVATESAIKVFVDDGSVSALAKDTHLIANHIARIAEPVPHQNNWTAEDLNELPWKLLGATQSIRLVNGENFINIGSLVPRPFGYEREWKDTLGMFKCTCQSGPYAGMRCIVRKFDTVIKVKTVERTLDDDHATRLLFRSEGSDVVELAFNAKMETDACKDIVDKFKHRGNVPAHWTLKLVATLPNGKTKVMPKTTRLLLDFYEMNVVEPKAVPCKRPASAIAAAAEPEIMRPDTYSSVDAVEPVGERPASADAAEPVMIDSQNSYSPSTSRAPSTSSGA